MTCPVESEQISTLVNHEARSDHLPRHISLVDGISQRPEDTRACGHSWHLPGPATMDVVILEA